MEGADDDDSHRLHFGRPCHGWRKGQRSGEQNWISRQWTPSAVRATAVADCTPSNGLQSALDSRTLCSGNGGGRDGPLGSDLRTSRSKAAVIAIVEGRSTPSSHQRRSTSRRSVPEQSPRPESNG